MGDNSNFFFGYDNKYSRTVELSLSLFVLWVFQALGNKKLGDIRENREFLNSARCERVSHDREEEHVYIVRGSCRTLWCEDCTAAMRGIAGD